MSIENFNGKKMTTRSLTGVQHTYGVATATAIVLRIRQNRCNNTRLSRYDKVNIWNTYTSQVTSHLGLRDSADWTQIS